MNLEITYMSAYYSNMVSIFDHTNTKVWVTDEMAITHIMKHADYFRIHYRKTAFAIKYLLSMLYKMHKLLSQAIKISIRLIPLHRAVEKLRKR